MTAEGLTDHGISPSFTWDDKYVQQLQILADTDEMAEDIIWPALKDAVKYLLEAIFRQWPSSSAPILHPAAALIPLHSSSMDDSSLSSDVNRQFTRTSNGHGIASSNEEGQAQPTEDVEAEESSGRGMPAEGNGGYMHENDVSVREIDMQAFFPSKSQAPLQWKGSWGKRIDTDEELRTEKRCIFTMLDDFVNQPPFTIQRLAELVLRPTEHHHTLPKYVSALKRLLSVTATRDAFPAHPIEDGEQADLLSEEEDMGLEVQTNGTEAIRRTPSIRSRTVSVPGSPTNAPLFSPIPFLMRSGDEGMPGGGNLGSLNASAEFDRSGDASGDSSTFDVDVPSMELAGADRTTEQAIENARRAGKGMGTYRGVAETDDAGQSLVDASPVVSAEPGDEVERMPQQPTTPEGLASVPSVATSTEPLGVPSGPVDEMDQVGDKHGQLQPIEPGAVAGGARAFSSTTSNVPSSEAAIVRREEQAATATATRKQNTQRTPEAGERSLKRIRSERNLGKSDIQPANEGSGDKL